MPVSLLSRRALLSPSHTRAYKPDRGQDRRHGCAQLVCDPVPHHKGPPSPVHRRLLLAKPHLRPALTSLAPSRTHGHAQLRNPDADLRFMALNDLTHEAAQPGFALDDPTEHQLVDQVLALVTDANGEVKSVAVKTQVHTLPHYSEGKGPR